MNIKPLEARIDSRLGDRSLFASSFDLVYKAVDSAGRISTSDIFGIRLANYSDPTIITVGLDDSWGTWGLEGVADRHTIQFRSDSIISSLVGRDLMAFLLDRKLDEKEYLGNVSAHFIIGEVVSQIGLGVDLDFPDYVLCGGYKIQAGSTVAQVVQQLISPFQLGRLVTLDTYVRSRILSIKERNPTTPIFGVVPVDYAELVNVSWNIFAPELPQDTGLDRLRAVGGTCEGLVPIEDEPRSETKERVFTTEGSEEEEFRPPVSRVQSGAITRNEIEVVRDENGSVIINTRIVSLIDAYGRVYRENINRSYDATTYGFDKILNPPWRLPSNVDLTGVSWLATEVVYITTGYDGYSDRKVIQYESGFVSFTSARFMGIVSDKLEIRAWSYDQRGDVSVTAELIVESGFNSEDRYVSGLNQRNRREYYHNDGSYKVRTVEEYNIRDGNVISRSYVDRSPVRDESLLSDVRGGDLRRVTRHEETEVNTVSVRQGDTTETSKDERRVFSFDEERGESVSNSFRRSVSGEGRREDYSIERRSESSSGEGRRSGETRTENSESESRSVSVSSKSIVGADLIIRERTESNEISTSLSEERRGNIVLGRRSIRRTLSSVGSREEKRLARVGDSPLGEPPEGYKWGRERAEVGASEEDAVLTVDMSPLADKTIMQTLLTKYYNELKMARVEVDVVMMFDSRIVPGCGIVINGAPTWWPTNSFYVVGVSVDSRPDQSTMRVLGYAWVTAS